MAFTRRSYEEIRDNILAQITKGIINEKQLYELNRTKYKLANTPVKSIVKVEGLVNGSLFTFTAPEDYGLTGDMLEWQAKGTKPDDKTTFYVNYVFGNPSGITDINPGSVVRTIVEAVSRELDFFYAELTYIYWAGFIDTATGNALDLVVSILGVDRKSAEHATGKVTFGRKTDPGEIPVERETLVYDGKFVYELKKTPVKAIAALEGTRKGQPHTFKAKIDLQVTGNGLEWLADGLKPDLNSVFQVDYVVYEQIKIPVGTTVSTYARRPEDVKTFVTTEEAVLLSTPEGGWEADVPVKAMVAGTAGNVVAGTITVMPQPLVGVEYVVNREDILTGVEEETDNELRERAKHALERVGKATKVSLESALRGIEGVDSVLIEDMAEVLPGVPGVVKVVVDGGDHNEIERVINETRAAGIKVEFAPPKTVHLDVTLTVILREKVSRTNVEREIEAKVRSYLSSLNIGEDVVHSRIVSAAHEVAEVYEIYEVLLKAYRKEGDEGVTSTEGTIEIRADERAVARNVNILMKERGNKGAIR